MNTANILLIGAGKMGGALLSSWQKAGIPAGAISVIEKNDVQVKALAAKGVMCATSLEMLDQTPDCVVLAVKPQSMDETITELKTRYGTKPLYLSIAAGKTLHYFGKYLGADAAVVRAMPNTPATIGKGISALIGNARATAVQKQLAEKLLGAAGKTVWLESESQMDAVTAISGSGPAYMFLFLEMLIDAGKAQGLPDDICKQLAIQTMLGSAELVLQSQETLAQLRKNVTSPGGTTEAALSVFMKNDALQSLVHKAVWQAVKRAKDLA